MKKSKRILAVIMALAMSATMLVGLTTSAADGDEGVITITAPGVNFVLNDQKFELYRIFEVEGYEEINGKMMVGYNIAEDFKAFRYDVSTTGTPVMVDLYTFLTTPAYYNPAGIPSVTPLNTPEMFKMASALWDYIDDKGLLPEKEVDLDGYVDGDDPDLTLVYYPPVERPPGSGTFVNDLIKSVVIENLPLGYYLVFGSGLVDNDNGEEVVAAIALTSTTPEVEVILKLDAPTLDKWVWNQHDAIDRWAKWTDVNIGDIVDFKLNSQVPKMYGYEKYQFIVHDIMSDGLTFIPGSVEVYIDDVKIVNPDAPAVPHYTVVEGAHCSFEVVFDPVWFVTLTPGHIIEIFFSAVLNESAIIELPGNPNEAYLEYSNNPYDENDTNDTPPSKVKVYTGALKLLKIGETLEGEVLKDAKFEMRDKNGKLLYFKPVDFDDLDGQIEGMAGYDPDWFGDANIYIVGTFDQIAKAVRARLEGAGEDDEEVILAAIEAEIAPVAAAAGYYPYVVTPDNGEIIILGLGASWSPATITSYDAWGEYTLKEIEAPEGYYLITEDIPVQVRIYQSEDFDPGIIATDDDDDTRWTYFGKVYKRFDEVTGDLLPLPWDSEDKESAIRVPLLIINAPYITEFPGTGGIGRTIFFACGIALMALAVVGLVVMAARKKKKVVTD